MLDSATGSLISLFMVIFLAALIPGLSSVTVYSRTVVYGRGNGIVTIAGVVLGDLVFISLSLSVIFLLPVLDFSGKLFSYLKLFGAFWVLYLGIILFISCEDKSQDMKQQKGYISSFISGLMITLADQKAVIFYLGVFPYYLKDIRYEGISSFVINISVVIGVIISALVSAKLLYLVLGIYSVDIIQNSRWKLYLKKITGITLVLFSMMLFYQLTQTEFLR